MLVLKTCIICKAEFSKQLSPKQIANGSGKYCSKQCAVKGTGNLRKSDNSGSNHGAWKGDEVKYNGLHLWVRHHKPKPSLCEECKLVPPLDLANKGIYNRDFNNWEYLCRKCHMTKDGRLEKVKETTFKKGATPWNAGIKTGLVPSTAFKKGQTPWNKKNG